MLQLYLCTYIAKARKTDDLKRALELVNWVADCSLENGVIPELGLF